jgi:hypothetical protein
MNTLTKSDIGRAVDAIRELSDVIEKLHKSTWPDDDRNDILRKAHLSDDPRASRGDAVKRAQDVLDDLHRRMDRLEAGRDMEAQTTRKTYTIGGGQS